MGEVPGEVEFKAPRQGRGTARRWLAALLGLGLAGALLTQAARDTLGDPLVREATLPLPGLGAQGPLRVLLLSDIHVAGPDMPPARLVRIVAQMNRLHPDMVLIAGDFTSDKVLATRHYPIAQALAPLAALRSRWGTVAVLGNHDYDGGAAATTRAMLEKLGIRVLVNQAARIGPLTIGGAGDLSSNDADIAKTVAAMRKLGGPSVLLAHEPDSFVDLTPDIPLMLAGHTHCGQIALPLLGPIVTWSAYGRRLACGVMHEHGAALVVGAGLGTSDLPIRFGAHGDVWLLTLTPGP